MPSITIFWLAYDDNNNRVVRVAGANDLRGFSVRTQGRMPTTNLIGLWPGTREELIRHIAKAGTEKQKALLNYWYPLDVLAEVGLKAHIATEETLKAEGRKEEQKTHSIRMAITGKTFSSFVGKNGEAPDETSMVDLLANLMHLSYAKGIDFDNCLRIAKTHYEEEKE